MVVKSVGFGQLNGIIAVNKPIGLTSTGALGYIKNVLIRKNPVPLNKFIEMELEDRKNGTSQNPLRKAWNPKIKLRIGHGGTLDPFASGVLVVGFGTGCRKLQDYLSGSKTYTATASLGYTTDTQDLTGAVVKSVDQVQVSESDILKVLPQFKGDIMQTPPMYSALKVKGKPLYHYARNDIKVPKKIEPRQVTIDILNLLEFINDAKTPNIPKLQPGDTIPPETVTQLPKFRIQTNCSGGTYIRTLVQDIGKAIGIPTFTSELIRQKQGAIELHKDTIELDDIQNRDSLYQAIEDFEATMELKNGFYKRPPPIIRPY